MSEVLLKADPAKKAIPQIQAAFGKYSIETPETFKIKTAGRPHPEEFETWIHEQSWPELRDRTYL